MSKRPTKTVNGIKIVGVLSPNEGACRVIAGNAELVCVDYDIKPCTCPFPSLRGIWLTKDQALPLLLAGDVK